MAKFSTKNLDAYIASLDKLQGRTAEQYYGKAIFEGAKIVADAIKANINALPIKPKKDSDGWYEYGAMQEDRAAITQTQKAGLQAGFGIAKLKRDGDERNVKAGFHGYNDQRTKKYPNGQPNAMIARSIEGGTSFSPKKPFVAPAIRKSRKAAEERMKEVIEQGIKNVMEG